MALPKTAAEAFRLVAANTFRPFDDEDFRAYSGVESDAPLICEDEAQEFTIIVDGDVVGFTDHEGCEYASFYLTPR